MGIFEDFLFLSGSGTVIEKVDETGVYIFFSGPFTNLPFWYRQARADLTSPRITSGAM